MSTGDLMSISCRQVMAGMLADGGGVEEEEDSYVAEDEEGEIDEYRSDEELLGFDSDDGDEAGVSQVKRQSMYVPRRGSRRKVPEKVYKTNRQIRRCREGKGR